MTFISKLSVQVNFWVTFALIVIVWYFLFVFHYYSLCFLYQLKITCKSSWTICMFLYNSKLIYSETLVRSNQNGLRLLDFYILLFFKTPKFFSSDSSINWTFIVWATLCKHFHVDIKSSVFFLPPYKVKEGESQYPED